MKFGERDNMRSIRVVLVLVCGVFLLAGLTQAAESPQVAEYTHHLAASKNVPGLHAPDELVHQNCAWESQTAFPTFFVGKDTCETIEMKNIPC